MRARAGAMRARAMVDVDVNATRAGRADATIVGAVMACAMVFGFSANADAAEAYVATLRATKAGGGASGTVTFATERNRSGQELVVARLDVKGLSPGKHGINVHENGDVSSCDDEGKCTGKSYNPDNRPHRGPNSIKKFGASACHGTYAGDGCVLNRHIGDLGNIVASEDGTSTTTLKDLFTSLKPGQKDSIVGRSVVIHAGADDFETEENDGNAGPIVLYGKIEAK